VKTKRPHMPVTVQRDAALLALGLDPNNIDWHHDPALGLRPYDPETGKWTPDANDPRHITPLAREAHDARYSDDRKAIDKTRRNGEAEEAFRKKLLAKQGLENKPQDVKRWRWPKRSF
jgi:hypothetical protein